MVSKNNASRGQYCTLHSQTLSPSGDKLSKLGFYLLTSLVFVFFQMLEFASVLVLKELYERKNDLDSGKVTSRQVKEIQIAMDKVLPFQEMNRDIDINSKTELGKASLRVKKPKFFERLPLTRRIDFLAFITFHLAYFLFNVIYWNQFGR